MRPTIAPHLFAAAALLAAALPPATLHAAPDRGGDFLDLLEQENHVFAASRYVQTIAETPANVSVLTREDINRFGWRSIYEALATLPGFYNAASQWPALGLRGIAIPGDFGSRILFMVNGMPIYEPSYGGFFIEYLDMDTIDRIEVVQGTGSALYGSGAVLGIVNLITLNGHDAPGAKVALEAASGRGAKLYGAYGRDGTDGSTAFVSASFTDSRGRDLYLREYDEGVSGINPGLGYDGRSVGNDASSTLRLFGRVAQGSAWLQGLYVAADRHDPLSSYGAVFNNDKLLLRERFAALEAGWNGEIGGGATVTARGYVFNVSEQGDYPYSFASPQPPGVADMINVTDLTSTQYGAEFRYDRFLGASHHLLAGVELKRIVSNHQSGDQPGLTREGVFSTDSSPRYGQYSLFAQDEVKLGEGRKLFLGARYDYYHGFSEGVKGHLSPRIAWVQQLGEGSSAKIIYGEAYRAPTIYESRYQDGAPAAATLWANPGLKPEITRTFEALWERELHKAFNWNLGVFLTRLANSPVQVDTPVLNGLACTSATATCNQYRNSDTALQTLGIKTDLKLHLASGMLAYASATVQRGTLGAHGAELASSPRLLLKGGTSRPLPWNHWNGALEASFVSHAEGRLDTTGNRTAGAPAYLLLSAALNADSVWNGWRASLRVNNLLDRNIYTVASRELEPLELVPAARRSFSLQIGRDF
jgi:iron complex outermembrane receptor protein